MKFKTSLLKSTTLEGAFLEAAFMLERLETISNIGKKKAKEIYDKLTEEQKSAFPLPLSGFEETNFFNISVDTDQQRCVILASLPARIRENSFGGYFLAKELFSDNEVADIDDNNFDKLLETP